MDTPDNVIRLRFIALPNGVVCVRRDGRRILGDGISRVASPPSSIADLERQIREQVGDEHFEALMHADHSDEGPNMPCRYRLPNGRSLILHTEDPSIEGEDIVVRTALSSEQIEDLLERLIFWTDLGEAQLDALDNYFAESQA